MYLEYDCLICGLEFLSITTLEKEKFESQIRCDNCDALHNIVLSVELIGQPLKED